jgi:hypothetical protein
MKIGEKVRIKESLSGHGFMYSEGEIVEITQGNIEHLEGLMRGGSAEAATFPDTPTPNRGENEGTDIHTDDRGGAQSKADTDAPKTKGRFLRGRHGDAR